MNVLACGVVYNEIDILPYLIDYYKTQDIELFIFDNFSTDGTWEFLQKNNIPSERLSSDGKFSLFNFIIKMTEKFHEIQPDWCIYLDADEFPLSFQFIDLNEFIADRAFQGFNVIQQTRVNFRPTGTEDFKKGDPFKIYRYYFINWPEEKWNVHCERIFKYSPEFNILNSGGHTVRLLNKKVSIEPIDNPIFHYTMREHSRKKILQMYLRRNVDRQTVRLGWNTHYESFLSKNKWLWDPSELHDIQDPASELYNIIKSSPVHLGIHP